MKHIKAAVIQQHNSADLAQNISKSSQRITELAQQGCQLILLQELHCGLYFCQQEDVTQFEQAQPLHGQQVQHFTDLAAELDVVLVISVFEKRATGLYHNTAVVLDGKQGNVGIYRKMHIPDDPGFYEKFYFTPGDHQQPFEPIQTSLGKLGVLVCWDQWYPDCLLYTSDAADE